MGLWLCSVSHANVLLGGTRVIYHAQDQEVTLKITNNGVQPALVQVWFDSNDPGSTPETGQAPVIASPPLFRVDPAEVQTLRIIYLHEPLPLDRESVFWLNVLDVPPMPVEQAAPVNTLEMAFRSRIKLFFRPDDLDGMVDDAGSRLRWEWHRRHGADAGQSLLRALNDSPYHLSLSSVRMQVAGGPGIQLEPQMVSPKSWCDFTLKPMGDAPLSVSSGGVAEDQHRVMFDVINDYGGIDHFSASLTMK